MKLTNKTLKKLDRLTGLIEFIEDKDNRLTGLNENDHEDFDSLVESLTTELLPLVKQLVDARLITVRVETKELDDYFIGVGVAPNGNIEIKATIAEEKTDWYLDNLRTPRASL